MKKTLGFLVLCLCLMLCAGAMAETETVTVTLPFTASDGQELKLTLPEFNAVTAGYGSVEGEVTLRSANARTSHTQVVMTVNFSDAFTVDSWAIYTTKPSSLDPSASNSDLRITPQPGLTPGRYTVDVTLHQVEKNDEGDFEFSGDSVTYSIPFIVLPADGSYPQFRILADKPLTENDLTADLEAQNLTSVDQVKDKFNEFARAYGFGVSGPVMNGRLQYTFDGTNWYEMIPQLANLVPERIEVHVPFTGSSLGTSFMGMHMFDEGVKAGQIEPDPQTRLDRAKNMIYFYASSNSPIMVASRFANEGAAYIAEPNVPTTGDNANLALWFCLCALACLGAISLTVKAKKAK